MAADLRNRELPVAYRAHLSVEKSRLEDEIKRLVDSRILLEADISLKKKSITEKKRYYKKFRVKKKEDKHTGVSWNREHLASVQHFSSCLPWW